MQLCHEVSWRAKLQQGRNNAGGAKKQLWHHKNRPHARELGKNSLSFDK